MTPQAATNWLEIINTGGVIVVLAAIVVYAVRIVPTLLERWGKHTAALVKVADRLQAVEEDIKELRHDINK